MGAKSQQNGNEGEKLFSDTFRSFGYWALIIGRNNQGSQPFDIIAAKGHKGKYVFWMVDAKVVENGATFSFSDIQPNQIESMNYAVKFANASPRLVGFAILFKAIQRMGFMTYEKYKEAHGLGKKSVRVEDIFDLWDYVEVMERDVLNN